MTLKLDRYDVASLLVLAATVAVTAAAFPQLPAQVPIHFDLHGSPNGWAPRAIAVVLLPGVMVLLWSLLRLGPGLLPQDWQQRMEASPLSIAVLATVMMLGLIQGKIVFAALHPSEHQGWVSLAATGGYFVVLGQLMPRVRRNPWIGIRTPFTLSSDENWLRTHRFAGYSMTVGGLLAVILAKPSPEASIGAIVVGPVAAIVYSYVAAKRFPPQQDGIR